MQDFSISVPILKIIAVAAKRYFLIPYSFSSKTGLNIKLLIYNLIAIIKRFQRLSLRPHQNGNANVITRNV